MPRTLKKPRRSSPAMCTRHRPHPPHQGPISRLTWVPASPIHLYHYSLLRMMLPFLGLPTPAQLFLHPGSSLQRNPIPCALEAGCGLHCLLAVCPPALQGNALTDAAASQPGGRSAYARMCTVSLCMASGWIAPHTPCARLQAARRGDEVLRPALSSCGAMYATLCTLFNSSAGTWAA